MESEAYQEALDICQEFKPQFGDIYDTLEAWESGDWVFLTLRRDTMEWYERLDVFRDTFFDGDKSRAMSILTQAADETEEA